MERVRIAVEEFLRDERGEVKRWKGDNVLGELKMSRKDEGS
ncbi:MAG: hypothetical protein NZ992_03975 [Candidatus Korarchaeum sp.]|nr:hypothetical protein [Candidatus Korarchaeum sp.]MDW8034939.1 hypothetical protein [Candidatus Korarchaeum sp.]